MSNFNDIRCYTNEEVHDVLVRLSEEKQFMKMLSTVYPLMPKEYIKQRLHNIKTQIDLQKEMAYPFLKYLEANMTKGIDLFGFENIDTHTPYIFISNHRDIILDSALLCMKLIDNKMDTVEIAIGNNLLIFPWVEELVRVNKSFIVKRGLTARQALENSQNLSAYITHTIQNKKNSIWLAQREGRAKNSDDRTQLSLLKMLNMSGKGDLLENLSLLNICPLSISYEYDPCDYLKAKEMQLRRDDPNYKKQPEDDLENMKVGVMGYKGKVAYHITGLITPELKHIGSETKNKNEQLEKVAKAIDNRIYTHYHIFNNNRIAYDLLNSKQIFINKYSTQEKFDFEKYISSQISKINLPSKDEPFLTEKILEMYANPLINQMISKKLITQYL